MKTSESPPVGERYFNYSDHLGNTKFEKWLQQDLSYTAERLKSLFSTFIEIYPSFEEVTESIQENNCFPLLKKVPNKKEIVKILNSLKSIVGNTSENTIYLDKHGEITEHNSHCSVTIKYESQNFSGSHYDRAYLSFLLANHKYLNKSKWLELSSGSAGASIALYAWLLGKELQLLVPDSDFLLRPAIPSAMRAKVILTPKEKGVEGASEIIKKIVQKRDLIRQLGVFLNHSNSEDTLPGIAQIIKETGVDFNYVFLVFGNGTTMRGIGEIMNDKNRHTQVIGVRYTNNPKDKSLQVPGNDEVNIEFPHYTFEPNKIIHIPLDSTLEWEKNPPWGGKCGLTSGLVREGVREKILSANIKQGSKILIINYESWWRCKKFTNTPPQQE